MSKSQITFSKDFIKGLLSKLKVGNRRGIHLNALPGRARARLDVERLGLIAIENPDAFLGEILTKPQFKFEVNFDGIPINDLDEKERNALFLLARRLNNIAYDSEDQYLEFGIKNFGLGYPLLIRRDANDPSKIIKAPLLIWKLNIEKSSRKTNSWTLSRQEDFPITVNELLRSHVKKDAQVNIDQLSDTILEDNLVDSNELIDVCRTVLEQLNVKVTDKTNLTPRIEKCPERDKVETLATNDAWIQWSGIFGLYKSRKESIIRSGEKILENLAQFQDEDLELENFQTSSVSAVDTDPSKEELINSLTRSEVKLIQGPPGTGKSQALTAIITNTLENGGRCLVVCEKKTALNVIYKNLDGIGLSEYCALIDDVNKDRGEVIRRARSRAEGLRRPISASKVETFDKKYSQFTALRNKFNERHEALFCKVLGEKNWKEVIGLFIKNSKGTSFTNLKKHLKYSEFGFNENEFDRLRNIVTEASNLYQEFDNDRVQSITQLSSELFTKEYSRLLHDDLRNFLKWKATKLGQFCDLLDMRKGDDCAIGNYSILNEESLSKGIAKYQKIFNLSKASIKNLENCLADTKDAEEDSLEIKTLDQIKKIFSSKSKALIANKQECRAKIVEYNNTYQITGNNRLTALPDEDDAKLKSLLDAFRGIKSEAQLAIKKLVEINKFLNDLKKLFQAIEEKEDNFTTHAVPSLSRAQNFGEFVESLYQARNFFNSLLDELNDYEPLHRWRHYLASLDDRDRGVVSALAASPEGNWLASFVSWYLYGLLAEKELKTGPFNTSTKELNELTANYHELQHEQIQKIRAVWDGKLRQAKTRYEQGAGNFNLLFNLRKNRKFSRTNSLRRIAHIDDCNLLSSVFPVILTNPVAADSILPLKQGLFEVVIFDEASQLRIEDTFTSFMRGQYKIVAGDKHQMPPSSYFEAGGDGVIDPLDNDDEMTTQETDVELALSESLLDYANNLTHRSYSYLDYHYRSRHPALIEFSNVAFYGSNLIPFPEIESYSPIELRQVNGLYRDRVNAGEVEEVIKIIRDEIHVKPNGEYPSLGIATFNINQRNEIKEALNFESSRDEEFALKLEGITSKKSGLFVKNLENIQGDEMDIIIISTTYGKGEDGRFLERFGPVNYEKGYKLLNVLITRAKHKVYVCTSIPRESYGDYAAVLNVTGNNRKGILYAYLAYADAISKGDNEMVRAVLTKLKENSYDAERKAYDIDQGLTESPFEQEVFEVLREKYSESQIHPQYKIGGFRIDFVIEKNGKKIAIECDGKTYHSSREAYAYDMYRAAELEKMGFIVYRIWSTRWWHHHEKEIEEMFRFIESH
jgi:very-short-patch-repair endonuclease